jgi:hypothetical protein
VIAHSTLRFEAQRQELSFEEASTIQVQKLTAFAQILRIHTLLLSVCMAFLTALGLHSCNDAPGPIGSELIPSDTLLLRSITNDELQLITSTSLGLVVPKMATELAFTSSSSPYFLGAARVPNADRFTASAFIRYQLPVRSDSVRRVDYDGLTASDIIDVRLFLRPSFCLLGDTTVKVAAFNVYDIRQRWYNDSITRVRTVPTAQTLAGQRPLASFSQFLPEGSIDAGSILSRKRPLVLNDKELLARWILSDSTQWSNNIFGLALVPTDAATSVFRFDETSFIVVRFKRAKDSTERVLTIFEDVQATISNAQLPPNPNGDELMIQGGTALRTALQFDLQSSIPPLSTIHQAQLVLPVDSIRSLVSTCGFPASVRMTFQPTANSFAVTTVASITAFGELNTTTGTIRYIFNSGSTNNPNMLGVVQQIVKQGGRGSVILHFTSEIFSQQQIFRSDEEQTFNRIIFRRLRGSSDPAFRPRLTITYSLRPR